MASLYSLVKCLRVRPGTNTLAYCENPKITSEKSFLNGLAYPIFQKTVRKPPKKKIETMNLPYYELDMVDGTVCDLVSSRLDRFRAAV
jgi:hypothetical protein